MPKQKTHKGASKRFKKTASGKLKRKHAYKSHNLQAHKKTKKQKRNLTKSIIVAKADTPRIKKLLK